MIKLLWKVFLFILSFMIILATLFNPKMLPYTIPTLLVIGAIIYGIYKFSGSMINKTTDLLKKDNPQNNDQKYSNIQQQGKTMSRAEFKKRNR